MYNNDISNALGYYMVDMPTDEMLQGLPALQRGQLRQLGLLEGKKPSPFLTKNILI